MDARFAVGDRSALQGLRAASLLGGLGHSMAGAVGGLVAAEVSGTSSVAGLPQAALVIGSALAAVLLSAITMQAGRRAALVVGSSLAVAGCAVVATGPLGGGLVAVLAGSLLLGAGTTTTMLTRYAAADLGGEQRRARSMGSVLLATTVGAVAGPLLLGPVDAVGVAAGLPYLTGPYVVGGVALAAAALVLRRRLPARSPSAPAPLPPRPAAPGGVPAAGLAVLALANLVMVGVMTMAPIHLHAHGSSLDAIGVVVALHIAGMFAPSPLSGRLVERIGGRRAAAVAVVVQAVACGAAGVGAATGRTALTVAGLILLGVGWNLSLLAGSHLLTAEVAPGDRPRLEGLGEVAMGLAAGGASAGGGPVLVAGGFALVAGLGAGAAILGLPAALVGRRPRRRVSSWGSTRR